MYIKHFQKDIVYFYESHWFCFRFLKCGCFFLITVVLVKDNGNTLGE